MPKITVVMPVYNEEIYLKECLESVINQTLKDIEIICVDDGSTDDSTNILRSYAKRDNRVRILQQKNSGAGIARNFGMTKAKGEYLAFLDSDDIYELSMLEDMYYAAQKDNLDVIVCRADKFDSDTRNTKNINWTIQKKWLPDFKPFSGVDVRENFFKIFVWWPWDKLFKKTYIDKLGIKFQNLRTTNDLFFVVAATLKAERISYIDKILAHHRRGLNSSLSVTREKSWDCFYHALIRVKKFLLEENLYERFKVDFINYALNFSLWQLNTIYGPSFRHLYNALKYEWFEEFGVTGKAEEFYYEKKDFKQLNEVMEMDVDSYLCHRIRLLEQSCLQNADETKELKKRLKQTCIKNDREVKELKKQLKQVQDSLSFKIGRGITYFPRKLRDFMR